MYIKISAHEEHMNKYYHKDDIAAKSVRDFIIEAYRFLEEMGNDEIALLEVEKFELLMPYFEEFEGKYDNLSLYLASWCTRNYSLINSFAFLMGIPKQDQLKNNLEPPKYVKKPIPKIFEWEDKGQPKYDGEIK